MPCESNVFVKFLQGTEWTCRALKISAEHLSSKLIRLLSENRRILPPEQGYRNSPASRELHRTGTSHHLKKQHFLRTIYELMRKHQRLEAERQKVERYEKSLRPQILRNQNAQKRLLTLANSLKGSFLSKYRSLLGDQLEQEIYSIVEKIEDVAFSLKRRVELVTQTREACAVVEAKRRFVPVSVPYLGFMPTGQ